MNTDSRRDSDTFRTFRNRLDGMMESGGISPKKAVEYAAMFVALGAIYYWFLARDAKHACSADDAVMGPSKLLLLMLKFFVLTGWPFMLMAAYDAAWRSKDAGNIFLAAYVAANYLWYKKTGCGFCIFAASFRIIPFVFCAWLAHGLGALRHRSSAES